MSNLIIKIKINLSGLERFQGQIDAGLQGMTGPIRDAIHQWAARYRSAMQERFDKFSKGGGDWAPLAASTIRGRRSRVKETYQRTTVRASKSLLRLRKAKISGKEDRITKAIESYATQEARRRVATRKWKRALATGIGFTILRDTNTLFTVLDPQFTGRPGQLENDIPYGIEVGFGGPAKHPKGRATIADIASFHQVGGGHLPARPILVDPPLKTRKLMVEDMERGLQRAVKQTEIR